MPRYSYNAIDHEKKTVKGTVTAESPYAARKHLRAKGLHPISIKESSRQSQGHSIFSFLKKTSKSQVADFTKQLADMLNAGIKLTEALSVLPQQITDTRLKSTIIDLRDRVVTGESFADTLSDHDEFFNVIYVSMVRVGESTGNLSLSLKNISQFMEKRRKLESKMVTAMIYPAFLVVACLGAILFLTTFVIPKIAEQIIQTGEELPFSTRVVINISETLRSWWALVIVAAIVIIVWLMKRFFKTNKGAFIRDKLLLALPLFGPLMKQKIVSRFTSTLATLLGAGLSMAESLHIVAEVTGNSIMNRAVKQARDRILSGADIATPLRDSGVISPAIAHMVAVGEKTGDLDQMLQRISENLESSSDVVIERLSAIIEPLIIVVMAMIVGFIVYATVLPLLKFSAGTHL